MLQIGDTIISFDVIEVMFVCNYQVCFGACCSYGDAGAPLEEDEVSVIEKNYSKIKPYISAEGQCAIDKNGVCYEDSDGDFVTTLINNKDCAFSFMENGVYKCGIEQAFLNGEINFQKPISCHLYPIRLKKYPGYTAVNYHKWNICNDAVCLGNKDKIKLYEFLKTPLIRKFGNDWYNQLCHAAENLKIER